MARRGIDLFGLSFLDAMTCGLGSVVLVFLIIAANVGVKSGRITHDLRAEVDRLEELVLDGHRDLVELRNSDAEVDDQLAEARGLSRRVLAELLELRKELATREESTQAREEHIAQLMSDLRTLEEEARRLAAESPPIEDAPGERVRRHIGDGDRQYLTGLKMGGRRILILVDASASMLDETIVNVIRRRNLPDAIKQRADKWQRAVATVDWITTQLPAGSEFQLYTFDETARPVVDGSDGRWLTVDRRALDEAVNGLRAVVPGRGTSLYAAFAAVKALAPDNVILLVDGLPTRGEKPPRSATVSGKERVEHYNRAIRELPGGIPMNVILFPMEGDPQAASAYWRLALATRGSFLSPPKDWP